MRIKSSHPRQRCAKLTDVQSADIVWMMTSSALVLLMVPGAALFYSGYSEAGSVRSLMWAPVMTTTVIGLQVSAAQAKLLYCSKSALVVLVGLFNRFFAVLDGVLGRHGRHCVP